MGEHVRHYLENGVRGPSRRRSSGHILRCHLLSLLHISILSFVDRASRDSDIAMGLKVKHLWQAPKINPANHKARSVPVFNVVNKYGRVFFFSWWGFLIAFWSW